MVKTVQRCSVCDIIVDEVFPQAECQQERCPRTTVESVLPEKKGVVAKPRKITRGCRLTREQAYEIRELATQWGCTHAAIAAGLGCPRRWFAESFGAIFGATTRRHNFNGSLRVPAEVDAGKRFNDRDYFYCANHPDF